MHTAKTLGRPILAQMNAIKNFLTAQQETEAFGSRIPAGLSPFREGGGEDAAQLLALRLGETRQGNQNASCNRAATNTIKASASYQKRKSFHLD